MGTHAYQATCTASEAMIDAIREFFRNHLDPQHTSTEKGGEDHLLQLATAALLVEMTQANFKESEAETRAAADSVRRLFELPDAEVDALLGLAQEEVREGVSLYQFTSLINKSFDSARKEKVIEMLWRVAYADGHKDKHEEYLVRKIADLLYLPHSVFIRTRHRVEGSL